MKNELKSMFTEHWKYLAVNAACKLNIFDKIYEGQDKLNKLVTENNWDFINLQHLCKFLVADNYLTQTEENTYYLTEKGNLLREKNPDGLFYACLNWSDEHLNSWQNLEYSIKTGKSSFEKIYEKPYFDYLNKNREKLNNYHKAMFEYALDDYKELPNIIDFSVYQSIMYVGGGYGAAISLIKDKFSDIKCFLFDLEQVVAKVRLNRITNIAGNFFLHIPQVAEAILLSRVLHDWNDEKAILILQNCFNALPENGTLYVIENCTDKIATDLSLLSLNMAAMCGSSERSSKTYTQLCETAGFNFQSSKQLNQLQTILIFRK